VKIGVAGLWHLGVMYAVGMAELGHEVIAYDPDSHAVSRFKVGELRVFEPGLREMLTKNIQSKNLQFTDIEGDLEKVELFILAYDTPVDEGDNADSDFVISEFQRIVKFLGSEVHILVSSQLPVGSSETISKILEGHGLEGRVIVQPENLRLGKAIDSFFDPKRIVAGTIDGQPDPIVAQAFKNIDAPIIWMHNKSAEVTKHALNAFLATSVTFMGELAEICEMVGADAKEVEIGLKSDPRIGVKAYLSPGLGFAGGTLARDVRKLSNLQMQVRNEPAIFTSLLTSNRHNNEWISRSLEKIAPQKDALRICFWGVSYTENTDTLRRSEIYEVMKKLMEENSRVSYVENLAIRHGIDARIMCIENIEESLKEIEILVVNKKLTKVLNSKVVPELLKNEDLWILDPSRILLELNLDFAKSSRYLTVGKAIK
jgi:UDPglucose 6-dehydrogenase